MNFVQSFTTNWIDIVGYALVDYVSDNMINRPLAAMGTAGAYIASGVNFALKQATASTKPLKGVLTFIKTSTTA